MPRKTPERKSRTRGTSFLGRPNGELERPTAALDCAPCAHNCPGAHGAFSKLSRPLQAIVRCIVRLLRALGPGAGHKPSKQ
jgi:hypothetical protein